MKIKIEHSSTKESQLKKKLLMYSLAAGVALTLGKKANAEIIYTDIDDVTVVQADNGDINNYSLNIDNNGTQEFNIFQSYNFSSITWTSHSYTTNFNSHQHFHTTTSGTTTTTTTTTTTNIAGTFTSTSFSSNNNVNQSATDNGLAVMKGNSAYLGACVAALNQSVLVSAGQNFATNKILGQQTYYQTDAVGLWPGVGQKFMGLKFKIGEDTHYGWVRLSVAENCQSFTIYDYAYEDVAGRGIKAGQTEGTLPVELSVFTAQFLNNKPTLYWSTQSETDNMGWYIYRNTENDFSSAKKTSNLIEGHGSTTQSQSYLYEDEIENFEIGQTYYYWLESIDYSGMINHYNLFAQLTIPHVNDPGQNVTPPTLYNINVKPNPIVEAAHISFISKEAGFIEGSIYNVKGELVKSFDTKQVNAEDQISYFWNGENNNGKSQSNGVYFLAIMVNKKAPNITRLILMR
jgi:hypothetical protein